jgi:hypothetical protein
MVLGEKRMKMLVKDLMTSATVGCTPRDPAEAAASLMKARRVDAIPVVADPSDPPSHAPAAQVARKIKDVSKLARPRQKMHFGGNYFYCAQPHELEQVLLLNRRRELARKHEVLI